MKKTLIFLLATLVAGVTINAQHVTKADRESSAAGLSYTVIDGPAFAELPSFATKQQFQEVIASGAVGIAVVTLTDRVESRLYHQGELGESLVGYRAAQIEWLKEPADNLEIPFEFSPPPSADRINSSWIVSGTARYQIKTDIYQNDVSLPGMFGGKRYLVALSRVGGSDRAYAIVEPSFIYMLETGYCARMAIANPVSQNRFANDQNQKTLFEFVSGFPGLKLPSGIRSCTRRDVNPRTTGEARLGKLLASEEEKQVPTCPVNCAGNSGAGQIAGRKVTETTKNEETGEETTTTYHKVIVMIDPKAFGEGDESVRLFKEAVEALRSKVGDSLRIEIGVAPDEESARASADIYITKGHHGTYRGSDDKWYMSLREFSVDGLQPGLSLGDYNSWVQRYFGVALGLTEQTGTDYSGCKSLMYKNPNGLFRDRNTGKIIRPGEQRSETFKLTDADANAVKTAINNPGACTGENIKSYKPLISQVGGGSDTYVYTDRSPVTYGGCTEVWEVTVTYQRTSHYDEERDALVYSWQVVDIKADLLMGCAY